MSATIHYRRVATVSMFAARLLLIPSLGCKSNRAGEEKKGVLISTSLSLPAYVRVVSHKNAGQEMKIFFPEMEIFNQSGVLVYRDDKNMENASILRGLPGNVQNFRPISGAVPLAVLMDAIPGLHVHKSEILGQNKATAVSIFLENCHACSVQEDALVDVKQRVLDNGINLLVIRVSRPGK